MLEKNKQFLYQEKQLREQIIFEQESLAKEIKENCLKEVGYEKDEGDDSENLNDEEDARRAKGNLYYIADVFGNSVPCT